MAIGSEPEIGVAFTTWGKMDEKSRQIWFQTLRERVERGNLLESYATLGYPTRRKENGEENRGPERSSAHNFAGLERWDVT